MIILFGPTETSGSCPFPQSLRSRRADHRGTIQRVFRAIPICCIVFCFATFFQFPWLWDLIWAMWATLHTKGHWLAMNIAWKHMSQYSIQGPRTPNWVEIYWDVWWYMESLRTGICYISVSLTFIIMQHAHINVQTAVNAIFRFCANVHWTWRTQSREAEHLDLSAVLSVSTYFASSYLVCLTLIFWGCWSTADISAPTLFR